MMWNLLRRTPKEPKCDHHWHTVDREERELWCGGKEYETLTQCCFCMDFYGKLVRW